MDNVRKLISSILIIMAYDFGMLAIFISGEVRRGSFAHALFGVPWIDWVDRVLTVGIIAYGTFLLIQLLRFYLAAVATMKILRRAEESDSSVTEVIVDIVGAVKGAKLQSTFSPWRKPVRADAFALVLFSGAKGRIALLLIPVQEATKGLIADVHS